MFHRSTFFALFAREPKWRLGCLILMVATTLTGRILASPESGEVNLHYVVKRAEERARRPFHSPRVNLPKVLANLNYDQYRQIRFRRSEDL